jgi:hypothetical protein
MLLKSVWADGCGGEIEVLLRRERDILPMLPIFVDFNDFTVLEVPVMCR